MIESITLELPEGLLTRAREAAKASNRPLETILTEWLEWGALSQETTLLLSDTPYHIYTPYGNEQAAQVLSDFLDTHQMTEDEEL
jgi:hypothetical protein